MREDSKLISIAEELICYLENIQDEDRENAKMAASAVSESLRVFIQSGHSGPLQSALSGKGIGDRKWNPSNSEKITSIIDKFWAIFGA